MAWRAAPTRKGSCMAKMSTAAPELETEVASRLRDPFEQHYMGVIQTADPLLIEKGDPNGEIYRDLKRDGKVFSGLQKRKLALVGREWQVVPVQDGAAQSADAVIVSDILKRCAFDQVCQDLLDALLRGFAVMEIVWTVRDGYYVPARIMKRAQRRFKYVQTDEHAPPELRLLTQSNMLTGEALPARKFIAHRVNPEDDNPYGTGLGLQLYWPVFFKRKGIIAWNKLNDRFGSPTPWGRYPRNASPKEKATLFSALKAMSNDGVLMTPEGMLIDLLETKLTGSVTTQQALCEYMDDWIAEVLLGQEPRTSGGGALAAASKERAAVRLDLVQADSDLLSATLNETLVAWICELNGLAPCQVFREIAEEEDKKAESETDKNVSEMGFELSEEAAREKYGEGWSRKAAATPPGSRPVPPATKPAGGGVDDAKDVNFAEAGSADAIDVLVDEALAGWKPMMQPFATALQAELDAAVQAGETAGEFLARLPALLAKMDPALLEQDLTKAASTARFAGISGVSNA